MTDIATPDATEPCSREPTASGVCRRRSRHAAAITALLLLSTTADALEPEPPGPPPAQEDLAVTRSYQLHFQATVATQGHPSFPAQYSGLNSMIPRAESATSVVMDLFTGARLWPGAELYFQPELAGGRGLSSTLGVAAFPSGEVYRIGDPAPSIIVARAYLRQVIGLGGGRVQLEDAPNQLAGMRDRDALTLTFGKVAVLDLFDDNPVSNDPHTRFESWGLWASAAYDYPADTRGYTWGLAADLSIDWWSVRSGIFLEPTVANGEALEWRVARARGVVAEFEARYSIGGHAGAARVLGFVNDARMGSYRIALENPGAGLDVAATRALGRTKAGFAASANQEFGNGLSGFLRLSWNDGQNETWAFTEIDRSVAAGAVQSGALWERPGDEAGLGLVVSGLSDLHRRYLAAGGYGFIIGDGALQYAPEFLAEIYYRLALSREVSLVFTYQPIVDPAFNAARGPIHVFTARAHVAF